MIAIGEIAIMSLNRGAWPQTTAWTYVVDWNVWGWGQSGWCLQRRLERLYCLIVNKQLLLCCENKAHRRSIFKHAPNVISLISRIKWPGDMMWSVLTIFFLMNSLDWESDAWPGSICGMSEKMVSPIWFSDIVCELEKWLLKDETVDCIIDDEIKRISGNFWVRGSSVTNPSRTYVTLTWSHRGLIVQVWVRGLFWPP